jgi:hypothetical protein
MFRFAELLVVITMVWIIANLLHYCVMRSVGWDEYSPIDSWLFGLSKSWMKKENNTTQKRRKNEF